jgi:hypothetical protein
MPTIEKRGSETVTFMGRDYGFAIWPRHEAGKTEASACHQISPMTKTIK